MNRKKVMVTMLAALAATSAWSDVSVMAESTGGASYVEKGSAAGDIAVAVGTASEAKGGGTIAIGRAHATSGNAVAIGTDATASGSNSMAFGQGATSQNTNSIAMGVGAITSGDRNLALGQNAQTEQWGAVAVGSGARATAGSSVAIGADSKATEANTVSVGADGGTKRRIVNVDAGRNDNDVVIMKQVFGTTITDGNNTNFGGNSAAWGSDSKIKAGKYQSGAIFGGTVLDNQSLAMGYQSEARKGASVAIGMKAITSGARNLALGQDTQTEQWGAVAVGSGARATADASVAIGTDSKATEGNTVSVGADGGRKRRIVNVDAGRNDNDVVIMRQVFGKAIADGNNTNFGGNSAAWGSDSKIKAGKYQSGAIFGGTVLDNQSLAMGYNAEVSAKQSVALGVDSKATEEKTVSVGSDKMKRRIVNVADGQVDNDAVNMKQLNEVKKTAENAVQKGNGTGSASQAVGTGSNASGSYALAVGNNSNAGGMFSISMGWGSQTGNNQSVAIGHDAKAQSAEAVAIGNSAIAQQVNAISIGNNSVAGLSNEGYDDPIWYAIGDDGKPLYSTSDPNGNRGGARSGAVAVGNGAKALGYRNIAIGENAITAKSKLKDGEFVPNAGKNNPEYTEPGVIGSIAIGGYAITEGSHSTVIGNAAYALGNYTSAYGIRSYAYGKDSSAFGNSATTMGKHSVAVGSYARADHDNSVALGSGSITDKAESTASYTIETGKAAYYATNKELHFAGAEAYGTVSVGGQGIAGYTGNADKNGTLTGYTDPFNGKVMMDKPIYRTVTNVAAGRISETSTDAINGSQLYYAIGKTEVNANDIKTNAGNITTNTTNIDNLQKDVDNQGKLIDANSKLIDANTSRIDANTSRIDGIDTRLNNQDERMNQQDQRLNDQETRLDQVEKNYAVQNGKIQQNVDAIKGLKERQDSIDSKLTTMDGKISGVQNDLNAYKTKTDTAIASINASQEAQSQNLTKIENKVSNNTSLITNVQQSVNNLDTRVMNNTTEIKNNETRITSVETTVKTHTAEIEENKENIAKNVKAIKVNKDNIAANTQSINELAQAQQQSMDGIRHAINDVRKESRQGDAMNAALAALKPLQYDPDEKTQIMAGVGGYKGEHAVALGLAHFFNDSLMANIGGAYTSGSSMIWNAGVTIKFGSSHDKEDEHRRTTIEYTPDVVVKEHIATLEQEVATSKAEMAALRASSTAQINELQKQIEELKRLLTK